MKRTLNIILLIFYTLPSYSQTNILVPITNFSTLDNRSVANVRAILKDKYGFIWVGTQDGLLRYDGRNAVLYNKNTPNQSYIIMNNDIDALLSVPGGDFIWVLNSYGGVAKIDLVTGRVQKRIRLTTEKDSNSTFIYSGIEYQNGYIYIADEEGHIFKIETNTDNWTVRKVSFLSDHERIQRFSLIGNHFLFCINKGKLLITDSSFEKVSATNHITYTNENFRVLSCTHFLGNTILSGTSEGVKKIIYDSSTSLLAVQSIGSGKKQFEKVKNILVDNSTVWVAYNNSLVKYFHGDNTGFTCLASKGHDDTKWLNDATFLAKVDRQLWIGSEYGIAVIRDADPFVPYFQDRDNTVKLNHCYSLYPENDSILYVCTDQGFYSVNYNNTSITKIGSDGYYITCFQGPLKEKIVSGFGGTFVKQNNQLVRISKKIPALANLDNDVIIASENFKDSLFFFASVLNNGLFIYNLKNNQVTNLNIHTFPLSLKSHDIKKLYIDKHNILWILCDNLISLYDIENKKIRHVSLMHPVLNEPLNIITDVCNVKDDYFLAVYGMGIIQINKDFKVEKIYANKEGIENVNLYKVFSIGDSSLITSGNHGLYTINLSTKKVRAYFENYGLHSNAFEELSGTIYKNTIMMGGINGFTIINPINLKENRSEPILYINKISIDRHGYRTDTSNILISELAISKNTLQVNVYFSAINYSNPQQTTFSYRIIEQSDDWTNLNTQNFLNLIGFSPGVYHLQIKAINEDGVPSKIKELTLIFLPKWYQTWWFKILLSLVAIAIVYSLYKFRINNLKKAEKVRIQVASDLHDELGSALNSVKVYANLALMEKNNKSHLEKIKESTQSAIAGVKDIIWVLDDKKDTLDDLMVRINQFAQPVCSAAGISYQQHAEVNFDNYRLGKEEKRNLYMIIKESINNSIKYADCSTIDLVVKNNANKLNIIISDNGKGFDQNKITSGYGLKNIIQRSNEIGYCISINSSLGNGSIIDLEKV
jgi:ligand-binding sensor domain-containing protein/two-component sensor histidine kinase